MSFISIFMIFGKDWEKKIWSADHFNKITTVYNYDSMDLSDLVNIIDKVNLSMTKSVSLSQIIVDFVSLSRPKDEKNFQPLPNNFQSTVWYFEKKF